MAVSVARRRNQQARRELLFILQVGNVERLCLRPSILMSSSAVKLPRFLPNALTISHFIGLLLLIVV